MKSPESTGAVLFVLPWSNFNAIGGVNEVVRGLHDEVNASGRASAKVLLMDWDQEVPASEVDAAGRSVIRLRLRAPFPEDGPILPHLIKYAMRLPQELLKLCWFLRRERVRVVNCHFINEANLTWIIARKFGFFRGKIFLSIHGADIRRVASLTGFRRAAWRWALLTADAVVAVSHEFADEVVDALRLDKAKMIVIHNGVDPERILAAADHRDQVPAGVPSAPAFINVGTLEHKKGHDALIEAFSIVKREFSSARLIIIGRPAGAAKRLAELIKEHNLEDSVRVIHGLPHNETLKQVALADVFVLSSRLETFCIALLEAGVLGKPVVSTDTCGVRELLQDGVNGLVVPRDDPQAMALAMSETLRSWDTAQQRASELRARIKREFTRRNVGEDYMRIIGFGPG